MTSFQGTAHVHRRERGAHRPSASSLRWVQSTNSSRNTTSFLSQVDGLLFLTLLFNSLLPSNPYTSLSLSFFLPSFSVSLPSLSSLPPSLSLSPSHLNCLVRFALSLCYCHVRHVCCSLVNICAMFHTNSSRPLSFCPSRMDDV